MPIPPPTNVIITLLIFGLLGLAPPASADDPDDGVPSLSDVEYRREKADDHPTLVYFYAAWCKHCKATSPVIARLAQVMKAHKSLRVQVCKLDAEKYMDLVQEELVSGFPTIRLFHDGESAEFSGDRNVDNILRWVERKLGEGVNEIKSAADARKFTSTTPVAVLGFFKDAKSKPVAAFKTVAKAIDKIPFAIITDAELFKEYDAEDGTVSVFKAFDDGREDWSSKVTLSSLTQFVERSVRPLVADFRASEATEVFGNVQNANKSLLVLFMSRREGHYDQHLDALRSVAFDYRRNMSFVSVNVDEADSKIVMDAFDLDKKTAMPTMRIFSFARAAKYAPVSAHVSGGAIRAFIQGVSSGVIQPSVPSEELPADWDQGVVKVLVRSNFEQVVFDGRRDVLVKFHTEGCQHCVALAPVYKQVGALFADEPSVVVAEINAAKNSVTELAGVDIPGVPTIVFYPKCGKRPLVFYGDRTMENIADFLRHNMSKKDSSEEDEDEEDIARRPSDSTSSENDKDEL